MTGGVNPGDVARRLRLLAPPRRLIGDDEWLSQRVARGANDPPDIDSPRPSDMGQVSVFLGRLTPAELLRRIRKGRVVPSTDDGARYAQVADLTDLGFTVHHHPTNRNEDHAVVRYPEGWDDAVAKMFVGCFEGPYWHREGDAL